MRFGIASLAVLAVSLPPRPAAGGPACAGRLSGAVEGKFACLARVTTGQDGQVVFVITPTETIPDVPTYQPGSFLLPHRPEVKTYTLDGLGMGMASVAKEGGTLFTATRTSGRRGEVTLTLRSVAADPGEKGAWTVHGSYRARLLPAGGGKRGEVVVEVDF